MIRSAMTVLLERVSAEVCEVLQKDAAANVFSWCACNREKSPLENRFSEDALGGLNLRWLKAERVLRKQL